MSEKEKKATTEALAPVEDGGEPAELRRLPAVAGTLAGLLDDDVKAKVWGLAKMLADSQFVPAHFRGKPADCFVACHLAARMHEDPITLLQNTYIVGGKPGLSARYRIALAERRGVFAGPITYQSEGKGDDLVVTAKATLAATGEEVTAYASMAMAKAEGWTKNPKYRTMPEQMLSYRAGVFLCRKYDTLGEFGFHAREELEDIAWAEGHGPRAAGAGPNRAAASAAVIEINQEIEEKEG